MVCLADNRGALPGVGPAGGGHPVGQPTAGKSAGQLFVSSSQNVIFHLPHNQTIEAHSRASIVVYVGQQKETTPGQPKLVSPRGPPSFLSSCLPRRGGAAPRGSAGECHPFGTRLQATPLLSFHPVCIYIGCPLSFSAALARSFPEVSPRVCPAPSSFSWLKILGQLPPSSFNTLTT